MKRARYQEYFSDAAIRQFLLARLPRRDQTTFESALFTDPQFAERVRLAELELTDDYVFHRLRRAEAAKFEEDFLCTGARAKLLSGSRALKNRYENYREKAHPITPTSAKFLFALRQPKLRFAFAIVLAALLVGTCWLVIRKDPQLKQEITRRLTRRSAASQPTPVETHHVTNPSEAQHAETPQPLPEHSAVTPSALTIALWPNDLESAPSLSVSAGAYDLIQFELNVPAQSGSRYRVEVLTAQGQSIYLGPAESSSASTVKFVAPRSLFKTDKFEIRLLDDNSKATVAAYYFRVE